MDQIRLASAAPAKSDSQAADALQTQNPGELRSLEDWELVLVGGGEETVCW